MKKRLIKNLMLVLTMVVLCFAVCVTASAEERTIIDSGECGARGDNVIWTLYDDGALVISGEGEMEDYGSAAANGNSYTYQPWRKKSIEPTFVSVKEGVSTIGNAAFAGLKKLETVILPNNIIKIGEIAFYGCEKLRNIIIPDGVLEIGDSAFFGCSSLLEIYIPDSVRNIGHNAFRICNLQKVVIGSGVERVGCWAFDPSNSINFEYLGSKEEWENILFYSGNENVIRAISNNEVITEIIDGITYQIIENKAIVVSADENVKDEVIIRDEVLGFPVVLIDHSVFSNNKNITEVVIPNSVVEIGDGTFFMCENLTKISFSKNLRTIGDQAFLECSNLLELDLPDSLEFIDRGAFYDCASLTNVKIPSKVTKINPFTFSGCESLKILDIPDNIVEICQSAFSNCLSLEKITIGDGVKYIDESAFGWCFSLTDIHLGENVECMGLAPFSCCFDIRNISVDEENQYFCTDDNGVLYTKDKSVLELYPPASSQTTYIVDSATREIGDYAFVDCQYLNELILPYGLKQIGECAFSFASGLKSIILPETVECIKWGAFYNVLGLETVVISGNIDEIGEYCFTTDIIVEENGFELVKEYSKISEPSDEMIEQVLSYITYPEEGTCLTAIAAHPGSTAEKYAAENGVDFVPTHFYEDEWTYDYDNMIRYRECTFENCDAREEESLETTGSGDVEIIEPVDPDTDFVVDVLTDYVIIEEALTNGINGDWEIVKAFDITMTGKDGVHVQPDGTVKVKLPLDWSKDGVYKVYRVNEDGTLTDMEAYRQGSHMVFDTDHFSIYVIVDESEKTDEPITPDTPDNTEVCSKCGRSAHDDSFVQRLICIIIMAKRLIISLFKK